MRYAILCYHREDVVCAWSKEEDDAVMAKLAAVHEPLARSGKLGPVARLMPTTAATTRQKADSDAKSIGFYIVDCASLDEALQIAQDLGRANPGGAYEIRPVALFMPGGEPGSGGGAV